PVVPGAKPRSTPGSRFTAPWVTMTDTASPTKLARQARNAREGTPSHTLTARARKPDESVQIRLILHELPRRSAERNRATFHHHGIASQRQCDLGMLLDQNESRPFGCHHARDRGGQFLDDDRCQPFERFVEQ